MVAVAVQTENLSVHIGENTALVDISCQIHEGEFVAVLGPNGAGKSVFLKILLGLEQPSSGTVRIMGLKPEKVPPKWIGYVPQVKTLDRNFPALAIELVVTGLRNTWRPWLSKEDREQAEAALDQVGAVHLADRSVGVLSGGELQRVYLARSLVRRPRLILLDEPVTGIDTAGEKDFYRVLNEFRQQNKATIIMVTHDWEVAAHNACHVLVLNQQLMGFGAPTEVLCGDCLKRAYGISGAPNVSFCPREPGDELITKIQSRENG